MTIEKVVSAVACVVGGWIAGRNSARGDAEKRIKAQVATDKEQEKTVANLNECLTAANNKIVQLTAELATAKAALEKAKADLADHLRQHEHQQQQEKTTTAVKKNGKTVAGKR